MKRLFRICDRKGVFVLALHSKSRESGVPCHYDIIQQANRGEKSMKKSYLAPLLFLLIFCSRDIFAAANLEEGVSQLANQISKSMQEKQSKKIAIIDFSDLNGNVTALGQFMAEELTTQLFLMAPGKFEVVERRQLLRLQEELALGQKGFIEEKSLKKM